MKREQLEQAALDNVCPCWTYELRDSLDSVTDEQLRGVIADSLYFHRQAHAMQPDHETLEDELATCPDYKGV